MKPPTESFVLHSWNQNAHRWNALIEGDMLESRRLVTNQAMMEVLCALPGRHILDVGCGEGWLVRSLYQSGRECRGIDGSAALIQLAQSKGQGAYQCLSYGEMIKGAPIEGGPFETIVLNFALFSKENTEELLRTLRHHLLPTGNMVIQSLHPEAMPQKQESHWEADVWQGLPGDFTHTYAWYQRSMEEWKAVFERCRLSIEEVHEPLHPHTQRPASVIFVLAPQKVMDDQK